MATSPTWPGRHPEIAVHVPTHRRPGFLADLVARLEAQSVGPDRFQVVIVDDASGDRTPAVLHDLASRTPLALAAVSQPTNRGAAAARNLAVATSTAPLLAFTDDDCLPATGWLDAVLAAAAAGADIVQGRTEPDPDATARGPWDHTIRISGPTVLFESCNIAYRRAAFEAAGGFDEATAALTRPGRKVIGEDTMLGARVLRQGGTRTFASDALVHHRYLPASYADHVREQRNLAGFPALARDADAVADALWARIFLTRRTAAFDLGVVGTVAAVVARRPAWAALAALPWAVATWPQARAYGGRPAPVRLAQLAIADAVGAWSLVQGSLRHRRLVL